MRFVFVCFIAALIFNPTALAASAQTPEVKAPDGTFMGLATTTGRQFLGIP